MSFPDIWAVVPVLCMKERTKKNNGKPARQQNFQYYTTATFYRTETTAETYKNKHIDSEWCAKGENSEL